jgi:hypothetical protein
MFRLVIDSSGINNEYRYIKLKRRSAIEGCEIRKDGSFDGQQRLEVNVRWAVAQGDGKIKNFSKKQTRMYVCMCSLWVMTWTL